MTFTATTPLMGMKYYYPHPDASVEARDGFLRLAYGDVPIPLLEEDLSALEEGAAPDYDMIGRGIYQALRIDPDCLHAPRYARLLQEGYPHFISELGSFVLMLDRKDLDALYMDRKINYLKIFALLEPDNPRLPVEIGLTYMGKGLGLAALNRISQSLFKAEEFLLKGVEMGAADLRVRSALAEVSFVLGRYERARSILAAMEDEVGPEDRARLSERLGAIGDGRLPMVPVVDYLEAVAVAFDAFERRDYLEASAILRDLLDDRHFSAGYPMAEAWYLLGACCKALDGAEMAREYLARALEIRPGYPEAISMLGELSGVEP